jgi:EmrB/QacA subfamily drug resistance transporter
MSESHHPSAGLILFVTTISVFATAFAGSSVSVALPLIGSEFSLGGVHLNWVVSAYVLTTAVLAMPLGRLADRWGRQLVFAVGMAMFTLASALGALAPDANWLIASRALAGIGGSMSFATVTAVLVAAYPPEQRGRVLGINIASVYFGLSMGPVLGGLIIQVWGWRSLLWLQTAMAAVVVAFQVARHGANDKEHHAGRFDWAGALLSATGLTLLLIGMSDPLGTGLYLMAAGIVLMVVFWFVELRAENPIFPVRLMIENRTFGFSNLASMFSYSATFGVAVFLSFYLQVIRGLTPAQTGLFLLVQPLVQAVFTPIMGRLSDRVPPRTLASAGIALIALGLALFAWLGTDTPLAVVLVGLVILGLGFALFSSPNTNAIMGSVERKFLGLASGTVAAVRVVGQMLSMGLVLVLLAAYLGTAQVSLATAQPFLAAQSWSFGISAALCALGVVASLARGK